jgi:hypothetical protein
MSAKTFSWQPDAREKAGTKKILPVQLLASFCFESLPADFRDLPGGRQKKFSSDYPAAISSAKIRAFSFRISLGGGES